MTPTRHRTLAVLLATTAILIAACSQDDGPLAPPSAMDYPLADSPDRLMANFAAAYQARDLAGYASLLHEDFRFVLDPEQAAKLDPQGEGWNRDEELATTERMFADEPITKDGRRLPPIIAIVFETFEPLGEWSATGPDSRFPHALRRAYRVQVRFERTAAPTLYVRGSCDYYCVAESAPGGARIYRLLGWVDRTGAGR
jgi:hypothetical protein